MRRGCKDPGFLPAAVPFPPGVLQAGLPPGRSISSLPFPAGPDWECRVSFQLGECWYCLIHLSMAWLKLGQRGVVFLLLWQWDVFPPYS